MSFEQPFEEPGDELHDYEYPDENGDESIDTVSCRECGADVYEDAVQCPVCGAYVTPGAAVLGGRPFWWILLGVLGILAAIAVLSGFLSR